MADQDNNPILSTFFGVEFGGAVVGAFRELSGLSNENAIVEYKASGPNGQHVSCKVPGRAKYGDITLKRGVTDSKDMWKWRALVDQGKMTEARKNGSVVMFNYEGKPLARWNFTGAWPSKITGPSANAGTDDFAIEELTIAVENFTRES